MPETSTARSNPKSETFTISNLGVIEYFANTCLGDVFRTLLKITKVCWDYKSFPIVIDKVSAKG